MSDEEQPEQTPGPSNEVESYEPEEPPKQRLVRQVPQPKTREEALADLKAYLKRRELELDAHTEKRIANADDSLRAAVKKIVDTSNERSNAQLEQMLAELWGNDDAKPDAIKWGEGKNSSQAK